jgi:GH35 family endo-1,4-beta-xylanase
MSRPTIRWAASASAVAALLVLAAHVSAQSVPSDSDLWSGAESRIEQHRKADATVTVTDRDGRPVSGAEVQIEQTRHAFLIGCNLFGWGRGGDDASEAEYRRRFEEVFNYATLPFYWWSYEREQGQPMHERTEQVARWCREHGIVCKGHPLAWNYAEPRWLPDGTKQILDLQLGRIEDCAGRFGGLIDIWDVVNEATHFDREDLQRRAPRLSAAWAATGQVEFTRQCLLRARKANPKATLLINDYRVDPPYARLVEQLVDDAGKPLYDAIGIQSHQHGGTWSNRKIWEVCEQYARFGVPLHFTETTILSGKRGWELAERGGDWASTPDGEAEQAREVERFYTLLVSHPAVAAITWWDFSDRGAWQRAPAGFLRKDMSPKPAYEVLHRLVKEKWWTRMTLKTDEQGKAAFRGTLGDYRLTVRTANGTPVVQTATLDRKLPREFAIQVPH